MEDRKTLIKMHVDAFLAKQQPHEEEEEEEKKAPKKKKSRCAQKCPSLGKRRAELK